MRTSSVPRSIVSPGGAGEGGCAGGELGGAGGSGGSGGCGGAGGDNGEGGGCNGGAGGFEGGRGKLGGCGGDGGGCGGGGNMMAYTPQLPPTTKPEPGAQHPQPQPPEYTDHWIRSPHAGIARAAWAQLKMSSASPGEPPGCVPKLWGPIPTGYDEHPPLDTIVWKPINGGDGGGNSGGGAGGTGGEGGIGGGCGGLGGSGGSTGDGGSAGGKGLDGGAGAKRYAMYPT